MDLNNIEVNIDNEIINYVENRIKNKDMDILEKIHEIVRLILKEENINIDKVSVCISKESKEGIKKLNNEYRGIDKSTDVLSFPIFEKKELESISKQKDKNKSIKELELGDIILCMEVIEKQSVEYETGLVRETLYMITHGMCHLMGYDHIDADDKVIMRALEKKILGSIGVE